MEVAAAKRIRDETAEDKVSVLHADLLSNNFPEESFDVLELADGRVFASALYRPLVAFDATTGEVLWSSEDSCTSVRASPAVVGSVVYLACFTGR